MQTAEENLIFALQTGDYLSAREMLESDVDVNWQNRWGKSAMHYCRDFLLTVELAKKGAKPDLQDIYGNTPLHNFAKERKRFGFYEIRYLLALGADPFIPNEEGLTPIEVFTREYEATQLHWWAGVGNVEQLALCLDIAQNRNCRDIEGWSAMHYAAYFGHKNSIAELIRYGADANCATKQGWTPVAITTLNQEEESLAFLLKFGGNPTTYIYEDPYDGATPLHICMFTEKAFSISKRLLESGANPNSGDRLGFTPLHYAAKTDKPELIRLLIQNGGNPNCVSKDALSPLDLAILDERLETIRTLLENGADPTNAWKQLNHIEKKRNFFEIREILLFFTTQMYRDSGLV